MEQQSRTTAHRHSSGLGGWFSDEPFKMTVADWWGASLIAQYLIAAALYGLQGNGWKALYWLSAAGIGFAVFRLR